MRREREQILAYFVSLLAVWGVLVTGMSVNAAGNDPASVRYTNQTTGFQAVIEDDAGLLTAMQEESLLKEMEGICDYGNVLFKTILQNNTSTGEYAKEFYRQRCGNESGVLFLIDMDQRNIYVYSEGDVYKVITKSYARTITDNVYRYASKGEYDICAGEAFRQIGALLEGSRIRQPMKYISNALLALILALFANFVVVICTGGKRQTRNTELLGGVEKSFFNSEPEITKVKEEIHYCPQGGSGYGGGGGRSGGGGGRSGGGGGGGGHGF